MNQSTLRDPEQIPNRLALLAGAGGSVFGLFQDWAVPGGIAGFFGKPSNAIDLAINAFPVFWTLTFTIGGVLISALIIIYAIANQTEYAIKKNDWALFRGVAAVVAILPIVHIIFWIETFDPENYVDGGSFDGVASSIVLLLSSIDVGSGAYFTLVCLLIIIAEAYIDFNRS